MLDRARHRIVLVEILKKIYGSPTLAPHLGFKGGTALYIFYNLPRFSVDLDFDLLDGGEKGNVFSEVAALMKPFGTFREKWKKNHTLYNTKVEISKRPFPSRYEVKHYLGIPMKVMVKEDMVAHKLMAMLQRMKKANRDIFDGWFFLKQGWPINRELLEQRAQMKYAPFLKKAIRALGKVDNRSILAGMGELLTAKQKAWVKEHLKEDTIFLLKVLLDGETRKR